MNTDKYLEVKKKLAKIFGYLVLLVSFKFSADGFGFQTNDSLFIGWILAFAVTTSQFIFNTSVKRLNPTIVAIGILAYTYSIWTNIMGFYVYRGHEVIVWDLSVNTVISIFGGAFVDVFPEMALAWGYNAGLEGDLIGNLMKLSGGEQKPPQEVRTVTEIRPNPSEPEIPAFLQKGRFDNGKNRQTSHNR